MYNNNINKPKKQISMKKHFLCLLMLSGACLTAYAAEDPRAGELGSGSVTQQGVTVKGVVKDAKG